MKKVKLLVTQMVKQAPKFFLEILRLVLQIIGTYFVGKYTIEKIVSIPASTWGWMALIVLIVILVVLVWGYTIVDALRGSKDQKSR